MNRRSAAEALEKVTTLVFENSAAGAVEVAKEIRDLIESRNREGKPAVLGLATGSTPVPLYHELIRLHKEEGLSFKNVITFNLDEELIEAATQRAASEHTTLDDLLRRWVTDYAERQEAVRAFDALTQELSGKVRIGGKLTREQLNER